MTQSPVIVWFRQDLRIVDNLALHAAAATGRPVIALYILDQDGTNTRPIGGAALWWLRGSLSSLSRQLKNLGADLILRSGQSQLVLEQIVEETNATTIYWNRCYEPGAIARDKAIKADFQTRGLTVKSFNSSLLYEPWEMMNKKGRPYRVFTPFHRMVLSKGEPAKPITSPKTLKAMGTPPQSETLDKLHLLPSQPDWSGGLRSNWSPGEDHAQILLKDFLDKTVTTYEKNRNFPGLAATSRLSPHLHFGEISARQIWACATAMPPSSGRETFLKEVVWREFGYHLLYYNPQMPESPLQEKFKVFPWKKNDSHLKAWQTGQTGYPIIDAGMRELWSTGTMHNRVRMIVASFLVKHLLIHWREGEAWFWDTLVDADLASNTANWQWVAGCGADAAPYFRVFNPTIQGEKFDADGTYVRRWVPEIATLPNAVIHKPWAASGEVLKMSGHSQGETYPTPIVDHKAARDRALQALATIKGVN